MSGIIVSVIVPFLESNNKLIDTLSSISEQKNINQENIEVQNFKQNCKRQYVNVQGD